MLGVSIEGEEKNRLGVTSALTEIWDLAIFQSGPISIKEENPENHGAKKGRKDAQRRFERSPRKKVRKARFCRIGRESAVHDHSLSATSPPHPPVRVRACVYKCLNDCQKKKEENAKEGGMVDNSSSSKAQMVSRGPAPLLRERQRAENAPGCSFILPQKNRIV